MMTRVVLFLMSLTAFASWSQSGYSGDFKVSDTKTIYHFTLVNGSLEDPVYTMKEGTEYIYMMYAADSVLLSGVDSITVMHKKDSLLRRFLENFSGTYAQYTKKGKLIHARHIIQRLSPNGTSYVQSDDIRMVFFPNGKPYSQFYVKNGQPVRSIHFFSREDGNLEETVDLGQYKPGTEVLIQNPWDYRMRNKTIKIIIE